MTSLFPQSEQLPRVTEHWCLTRDGDPYGYAIYRRHYSARKSRKEPVLKQFVGPGRKLVLLSTDGLALFVWRLWIWDVIPKQTGWNCAVFRNESPVLSSTLIREAVQWLVDREGPVRMWTLVDAKQIRSSNPGCCFIKAGWERVGVSKTGKIILAKGV